MPILTCKIFANNNKIDKASKKIYMKLYTCIKNTI